MQGAIDERDAVTREREIPVQDDRLEQMKSAASSIISDSKLDEEKARALSEQIEKFVHNPGEMPREEYSSMVVSFMVLGDERSDSLISEIFRERSEGEGRNLNGKEESLLKDSAQVTRDSEIKQCALSRDEDKNKCTPPELPMPKEIVARGASYSPDIEKVRAEARDNAVSYGAQILNEIRDSQKAIIQDYVREYHGGLTDTEQERLSDSILSSYISRDDRNSVSDFLKEDVSKLADILDNVAYSRNEDVKSVLDLCVDRQQGNIRDFIPSEYNMSPRAGEENKFTEIYSDLKGLLPPAERGFYSDARMAADMRDEALKETLISSLSEIADLRTSDAYDRDKADRAADAVQEIMFENRLPSAMLTELLARDVSDKQLTVSTLEIQPDPNGINSRLEVAQEKLAVVLNAKFDSSITEDERMEVISNSCREIVSCERELAQNGSLTMDRDEMKLKHELLEELARGSDLYKGSLNETLHSLNYTIDLKNNATAERLANERADERASAIQEAKENLERLLPDANRDNGSLREQIASRDGLSAELAEAARAYEKAYFSDAVNSYVLTLTMRDAMAGEKLSQSQANILKDASNVCDLLNEARGDDKQLKDYYPSLEWDSKNPAREQAFNSHADRLDREKSTEKLQKANDELYNEIYSKMKNDLCLANSKYDDCLSKLEKFEDRGLLSERSYEKLSELKGTLNSLKGEIVERSQLLNNFSVDYERGLPEFDSRYDDIRGTLATERDYIASNAMHRTGTKIETLSYTNTPVDDKYEYAGIFNERCKEMKSRDEELSHNKLSKLLERPVLTKEQQERFETSSEMRETLMRERQDAIERVRGTFSKYDLERMDEALAHNLPCSVPGFSDYADRLEKAKADCERDMAKLNTDIKELYVNRYNELSEALDKLESGRMPLLNIAKDISSLSRSDKKELALYQQLSEEEKNLGDIISARFGDENYRIESARHERAIQPRDDEFSSRNLSFSSESDARAMLRQATKALSSEALDYDRCKSIAIEKDANGTVDERLQEILDKRATVERAADSAFQYLVRNDNYTSADSRLYEKAQFIYDSVRLSDDDSRLVLSREIKKEIDARTESINEREIATKQADALDRARDAKYKSFFLGTLKEKESTNRDIREASRSDDREVKIKETMFNKLSDTWATLKNEDVRDVAGNILYYWADRLSPRDVEQSDKQTENIQ